MSAAAEPPLAPELSPTSELREAVAAYTRGVCEADTTGHDWWHVERVRALAVQLAREEEVDEALVELVALVHDLGDYKLAAPEQLDLRAHCLAAGCEPELARYVCAVVERMHFPGAGSADAPLDPVGACVRDADRLDALGAVGIARVFAYGGHVGRPIWVPGERASTHLDRESYRASQSSSVGHFHEKLLLLRDRMSTTAGRRVAEYRHGVMLAFLEEFHRAWAGEDAVNVAPQNEGAD